MPAGFSGSTPRPCGDAFTEGVHRSASCWRSVMSDVRTILKRGIGGATPPPEGFERMLRRRDRKRRNQRIAAAVVGVAVFVVAIWTVTAGEPIDRGLTPDGTGHSAAPGLTEPVGLVGLPPEDATPSLPKRG